MGNQKIYGLFILVSTLFGSTFLAISLGLKAGASPLFYAALRFTTAGGILLTVLILSKRASFASIRSLAGRGILFSLFMTVGSFGCMFIAQTRVDSGFMARFDASGPLVTALFAVLFLGKRLSLAHFAAFFLGTTGTFLIASPAARAEPVYLIAAAGTVLFYAAGNVLYPLLFSDEENPVLISAIQAFVGGIILLGIALGTENLQFPSAAFWPFLYLVIGGSIFGHTAALILVRDAGPVFASGWLYVSPVIATVLGVWVLDESITAVGICGTIMALAGVFILGRTEEPTVRPQDLGAPAIPQDR
ncbi:DMT family transporter [Desulfospira joergensenii]|uniref:DMT family transporter n=1 Tax=Desulfospira joergensenii TaxID=53329 RepID=UPI0003B53C95|nr:EamA family transporter [Desulfospira joergensenii]